MEYNLEQNLQQEDGKIPYHLEAKHDTQNAPFQAIELSRLPTTRVALSTDQTCSNIYKNAKSHLFI